MLAVPGIMKRTVCRAAREREGVRDMAEIKSHWRDVPDSRQLAAASQEPVVITRMIGESWRKLRQYVAFVLLSIVAVGLTAILIPSSSAYFQRFFGRINPMLVVAMATVVGGYSLVLLQSFSKFEIIRGRRTLRGMAVSAGVATLLAVAIIIADFFIRYPEDTNVPVPEALLFYPAMGFVAEIVFHVFPLALLLLILSPLRKWLGADRHIWVGIVIAAVLEPTFQVVFAGEAFSWASAYTWVHVFAVAFLQLYVFQRYDFMSMYSFRLFYYAHWHIAWGVIRLTVLF
jgi:hypothetical protein